MLYMDELVKLEGETGLVLSNSPTINVGYEVLSGQLSNEITAKRNVNFYAFALISAEGVDFNNEIMNQFDWLKDQGFDVVEHYLVGSEDVVERVGFFEEKIKTYDLPSDGLVLVFNDNEYGISLSWKYS